MRPDSYSETSQVSSSCLDAGYEHARTQSPKGILPLSYFILQSERGYNSEFSMGVRGEQICNRLELLTFLKGWSFQNQILS